VGVVVVVIVMGGCCCCCYCCGWVLLLLLLLLWANGGGVDFADIGCDPDDESSMVRPEPQDIVDFLGAYLNFGRNSQPTLVIEPSIRHFFT